MTIHLPEDLKRYLQDQVRSGRYASEDEAISAAVRLLQQSRPQQIPPPNKQLNEQELDWYMLQSGFLGSIPPGAQPTSSPREFQPLVIEGEPLSETVIRERR